MDQVATEQEVVHVLIQQKLDVLVAIVVCLVVVDIIINLQIVVVDVSIPPVERSRVWVLLLQPVVGGEEAVLVPAQALVHPHQVPPVLHQQ